jgi:hypothetical protein
MLAPGTSRVGSDERAVASHEDALAPADEAAAAERMSATRSGVEHVAQSSDPLPPSRIEGAANRGGHGRQHPLRFIVRHRQQDTRVEDGEAGGMQARRLGKECIPIALARDPQGPACMNFCEQGRHRGGRHGVITFPETRASNAGLRLLDR